MCVCRQGEYELRIVEFYWEILRDKFVLSAKWTNQIKQIVQVFPNNYDVIGDCGYLIGNGSFNGDEGDIYGTSDEVVFFQVDLR